MRTMTLALILSGSLALLLAPAAEELQAYPKIAEDFCQAQLLLTKREEEAYSGIYKLVDLEGRTSPLVNLDRAEDLLALAADARRSLS